MTSLENSDSAQLKLIHQWHRGFSEKNVDILRENMHKDYRHYSYPRSVGKPVQTKEEWLAHIAEFMDFATGFEVEIHSVVEAPGKVVLHATNEVKNSLGVDTKRESIFTFHLGPDESGVLKVTQVDNFTDSKAYLDVMQAIAKVMPRASANINFNTK